MLDAELVDQHATLQLCLRRT